MNSLQDADALMVRPMGLLDAVEVSVLVAQLGYERSPGEVSEWIARLSSEGGGQTAYVACLRREDDREEVVGWIEVAIEHRLQSAPSALIGGLVVKEGLRGLGVGRRLCAAAEAWAWQHEVTTVRVTSRSTRVEAHRFYLRDGYRQVKTSLIFEKQRPAPSRGEADGVSK